MNLKTIVAKRILKSIGIFEPSLSDLNRFISIMKLDKSSRFRLIALYFLADLISALISKIFTGKFISTIQEGDDEQEIT